MKVKGSGWHGVGGRLAPIGFLLGQRQAGPWSVAHWPILGAPVAGAAAGAGLDYPFAATPRWPGDAMMWALAVGRHQTQPAEASSRATSSSMSERPAPVADRETDPNRQIVGPAVLQLRPAPLIRALLQLELPRPPANAPLALRWVAIARPFAGGESLAPATTPSGFASRAGEGGPGARPPQAADETGATGGSRSVGGPVPGLATSLLPVATRQIPGAPRPMAVERMMPVLQAPGRAPARQASGVQKPATGTEAGVERAIVAGDPPMAGSLSGRARVWGPLAFHLPARAARNGDRPAAVVSPELVDRRPSAALVESEADGGSEQPASSGRFRSSVAREVALLVREVTRVVEERVRPAPEPPRRPAQPPPAPTPHLDASEVFRLAQREHRERAFRMGR